MPGESPLDVVGSICDVLPMAKTKLGRARAKLERNPAEPRHLLTVRGVGYKWSPA